MIQQPPSVTLAVRLVVGLVVLGAVVTVLTIVQRDELVEAWSVGHPAGSSIQPPAFVPVAIVLYIVVAGLVLVLIPFLRTAHNWARWSLVAMVLIIALSTLACLRTDPPALFVVCSVASLPLDAAILYFLMHRDTSAFLRDEVAVPG
jgi:protein-S-isoprenylcysteine O-methyltransferase Ste14